MDGAAHWMAGRLGSTSTPFGKLRAGSACAPCTGCISLVHRQECLYRIKGKVAQALVPESYYPFLG